ncbi:MAG: PqqD family protein [Lutisporaceae bacterium]
MYIYKKTFGSRMTKIGDDFIINNGNMIYKVNEVAARIFELCNATNDEHTIQQKIIQFYQGDEEIVREDIEEFFNTLLKLELIEKGKKSGR